MKVFIRVDASVYIGSGHVMRCLSLADMLNNWGCYVVFVMRSQPGDLCAYTESRGFQVERLRRPPSPMIPRNTGDYRAWLQVSILGDVEDFFMVGRNADMGVVGH